MHNNTDIIYANEVMLLEWKQYQGTYNDRQERQYSCGRGKKFCASI